MLLLVLLAPPVLGLTWVLQSTAVGTYCYQLLTIVRMYAYSFFYQVWGIHQLVCTQLYWLGRLVYKFTKGYTWGQDPYRFLIQESQNNEDGVGSKDVSQLKPDSATNASRRSRGHNFTQDELRELRRVAAQCRSRRSKLQPQTLNQLPLPSQPPKLAVDPLPEASAVRVSTESNLSKPHQSPTAAGGAKPYDTKLVPTYSGWEGGGLPRVR